MNSKGLFCLLFCIANVKGAALPEPAHEVFDYHLEQLGVHVGLKLEDKALPLKGGKIIAELPVHTIFQLIEGEPTLFKKIFVPFKEELYTFYTPGMLERLRDVLSVKMAITYKAEHFKSGLFDAHIDYTFVHPDYSEEIGTVHAEGKTGTSVTLEVVSKNDIVVPKYVLKPFKVEASFQPNSEFKISYTEPHYTFETTLSKEGQTFKLHTICISPEHEYNYEVLVDVAAKKVVLLHKEDGTEMTHMEFLIQGNLMNLRKVEMKGKVQATRWWEAGNVESVFLVKGNDYEMNITFNDKEIVKTKINVQSRLVKAKMNLDFLEEYKGTLYFDYDSSEKKFEVKLPKEWFADKQSFVIVFEADIVNPAKLFMGGKMTVTMMREFTAFLKLDLGYDFNMDATKYEFVPKFRAEALNTELMNDFFYMMNISKYEYRNIIYGCFSGPGLNCGTNFNIYIDRQSKNYFLNAFKVEGAVSANGFVHFELDLQTIRPSKTINVYYPKMLQKIFNKPMERLEISAENVFAGDEHTLTITTNVEDMVFEFKHMPQHVSVKVTKDQITFIEFVQEFTMTDGANTFLFTMKPKLNFHEESYVHKELCHFSKYTCFTELVGDVKIEVADKSAKKVDMKVHFDKDTAEIYHLEASNKVAPYTFVFRSPFVVPFFKYMKGQSWLTWMMPVVKSPFDVEIHLHPVEKTLKVVTDIDTYKNDLEIVPLGGDKYNILFNNEVVVEFVAATRNFEIMKTMKDGRQVKTTVTWDNNDMLDNTATITVVYKDTPQVITIGWNVRDLAHGKVKLNVAGKKAPIFGDFELARNINWNVKSPNHFEMLWDGKASSNTMETLATPVMTEAKVIYTAGDVDIEMKEMFNAKTFTLMFKTRPFKFAILPFFEI